MPKPRYPHCYPFPSRAGTMRWYVRKGNGPKRRVLGEYGSPEFEANYYAIMAGSPQTRPARPPGKIGPQGTLRWLVDMWKRSSDWEQQSLATRKQRDNILNHVLKDAGEWDYADINEADIRDGRERRKDTPAAANNYLKTMRALFRWAKECQHVVVDPAKDVKFLKVKTEGFKPWTMDDIHAYRKHWPLGTKERLALEIYINTGFRRGDAAAVGRQHTRDGIIMMKAGKNKVDLYIPILPNLQAAIEAGPIGEMSFLTTRYNRPFTKESLGNLFREWCDAAGVKGKSAHGIRKLAATVVADNGASEQELQALFGWTTNAMSAVYTREANRKRQALQAAFKLLEELERKEDSIFPSLGTDFPSPGKNIRKSAK